MSFSSKIYFQLLIFTIFLISFSFEGPCILTKNPENYVDCRDRFGDEGNYCCYLELENKDAAYCVELKKEDVDNGKIESTISKIEKGEYQLWKDYTANNTIDWEIPQEEISQLRCTKAENLFFNKFVILAIIALLF